jgi:hypothetical protein
MQPMWAVWWARVAEVRCACRGVDNPSRWRPLVQRSAQQHGTAVIQHGGLQALGSAAHGAPAAGCQLRYAALYSLPTGAPAPASSSSLLLQRVDKIPKVADVLGIPETL